MDSRQAGSRPGDPCADPVTLQALLDGELDDAQTEVLMQHLLGCEGCAATVGELRRVRACAVEQLGRADDVDLVARGDALARVQRRIETALTGERPVRRHAGWLAAGLGAAALFLLLVTPTFVGDAGASADRILAETIVRERAWATQPNKVLHWLLERDVLNTSADGRFVTECWQANGPDHSSHVAREYDEGDRLVAAYWRREDGREVRWFSRTERVGDAEIGPESVLIVPATADLRSGLASLDPSLRQGLEDYLRQREAASSPMQQTRDFAERFRRKASPSNASSLVEKIHSDSGDLFHIKSEHRYSPARNGLVRLVQEDFIRASDFRRYRFRVERHRVDGSIETEDARLTYFDNTSYSEFEAATLTDLMAEVQGRVALSVRQVAGLGLRSGNRAPAAKTQDRQSPR
jgi:anti-sigma factor RsiW